MRTDCPRAVRPTSVVGVAAMKAGLATVISSRSSLRRLRRRWPSQNSRWAGLLEKMMWANFSISWRTVVSAACRTPDVPSPFAAGDGDQDVFLRPFAFLDDLAQLVEVDLELRRTMPESRAVIRDFGSARFPSRISSSRVQSKRSS